MNDYRLALMAGIDIPLPDLHLVIHVPTIKEIAYMGESEFFLAAQYLCLNKESLIQDETLLSSFSNFQVLMKVLEQSEKKTHVSMLLKLLFPDKIAVITKNSIILTAQGSDIQPVLIDNNNFEVFQQTLKEILCITSIFQGDNVVYNPANDKAKEIADKLMRGRRRVAAQKGGPGGQSILTRYISILTIGTQTLSIEDCLNLNLFQLFDLMERYNKFVEWDIDLRARLAGATPDKQVESWMKDLHPKN